MALYTTYWPDWMCERAKKQGLEGLEFDVLWGDSDSSFSRFKVGPGDTVVPITCVSGVLFALASIHVDEKTSPAKRPGFEASPSRV